jgi:hypothetical protein
MSETSRPELVEFIDLLRWIAEIPMPIKNGARSLISRRRVDLSNIRTVQELPGLSWLDPSLLDWVTSLRSSTYY